MPCRRVNRTVTTLASSEATKARRQPWVTSVVCAPPPPTGHPAGGRRFSASCHGRHDLLRHPLGVVEVLLDGAPHRNGYRADGDAELREPAEPVDDLPFGHRFMQAR